MPKTRRKRKSPKRVLALPDLEQAKSAVLNTLTSKSGQRTYDHAITEFVEWYCSELRLAFNRTVVLRYRNQSRTEAVRTFYDESPPCGRQKNCLRSDRFRFTEPGAGCWHSPCERSTPAWCAGWEPAYCRAGKESAGGCRSGHLDSNY